MFTFSKHLSVYIRGYRLSFFMDVVKQGHPNGVKKLLFKMSRKMLQEYKMKKPFIILGILISLTSLTALGKCPDMMAKAQKVAKSITELENGGKTEVSEVEKLSFNVFKFSVPLIDEENFFIGTSHYEVKIEDSGTCSLLSVVKIGGAE